MARKKWQADKYDEVHELICEMADYLGDFNLTEISKATGLHRHTVKKHLDSINSNLVKRNGRQYSWQGHIRTWKINSELLTILQNLPEGWVMLRKGGSGLQFIPPSPKVLKACEERYKEMSANFRKALIRQGVEIAKL